MEGRTARGRGRKGGRGRMDADEVFAVGGKREGGREGGGEEEPCGDSSGPDGVPSVVC